MTKCIKSYVTIFFLFSIVVFLVSCNRAKQSYPAEMTKAEKILINDPGRALSLLKGVHEQIKEQPEETQMYYELLFFRAQDMCFITHNSKDTIERCIDYYEKDSNSEKLMMAYYCLGCYYRDQNNYTQAAVSFQEAIGLTDKSKNYSLIGRIYNQLAALSNISKETLALYKKSTKYFELAKDSVTLAYSLRDVAAEYQIQKKNDSALKNGLRAYQIASNTNNMDLKHNMENELANYYISATNYIQAIDFLKKASIGMRSSANIAFYYFNWAQLYKKMNKPDSAISYYNKCIMITSNIDLKYNSYLYLHDICEKIGSTKEALFYGDIASSLREQVYQTAHDKEVTKLNALYNYNRIEKENDHLKIDNAKKQSIVYGLFGATMFLILAWFYWADRKKKQRAQLMRRQQIAVKMHSSKIEENNKEIEMLTRQLQEKNTSYEALESQIKKLEQKNTEIQEEKQKVWNEEYNKIKNVEIILFFHHAVNNKTKINDAQWDELKAEINNIFNDFNVRLICLYPEISDIELKICNLIKGGFNPNDISKLVNRSAPSISSIRSRLYTKITGETQSTSAMDQLLKDF
jgi:tetratricopeptide (TPR) repeat protein